MRLPSLAMFAFLIPLAVAAETTVPTLPVAPGGVMILSAATADFAGYRIVVAPDGTAFAVDGAGRGQRQLSPQLTKTLFDDLTAAMPLSKLAGAPCAPRKPLLLPIVVTFQGETSPDITCAADSKESALNDDVQAIAHALYVANYRSRAVSHFGSATQSGNDVAAPAPTSAPPQPSSGGGYGGYGHR